MTYSLLICALCLACTMAELLPITEDSYPYLKFANANQMTLSWHTTYVAQRAASAAAIRVNGKGVRFISALHSKLTLGRGWESFHCSYDVNAMCRLESTLGNVTSRAFPTSPETVYSLMETPNSRNYPAVMPKHCPEAKSGRIVSDDMRDLSLCDVIGVQADFVYEPHNNVMHISTKSLHLGYVIAMSIATVYIAIVLSTNLDVLLHSSENNSKDSGPWWINAMQPSLMLLILVFLIIIPNLDEDILHQFITLEDRFMFVLLTLFCGIRLIPELYMQVRGRAGEILVNPFIALLILMSMRFFCSLDNAYAVTLSAIFTIRWTMKLYTDFNAKDNTPHNYMQIVESFSTPLLVSCLLYFSVAPFYDYATVHIVLFTLQCWLVGTAVPSLLQS